jgi:hypothetical protein
MVGAEDKRHRVEKKYGRLLRVWHGNEFNSGGGAGALAFLAGNASESPFWSRGS